MFLFIYKSLCVIFIVTDACGSWEELTLCIVNMQACAVKFLMVLCMFSIWLLFYQNYAGHWHSVSLCKSRKNARNSYRGVDILVKHFSPKFLQTVSNIYSKTLLLNPILGPHTWLGASPTPAYNHTYRCQSLLRCHE